jgi:hypothetical protein
MIAVMGKKSTSLKTFTAVCELWPNIQSLADDMGVPYTTAQSWKNRDTIPAPAWQRLLRAANKRNIPGLSVELFAKLAGRAKPTRPSPRASSPVAAAE